MGSIFDDFDSVELPEGSREIVYGVNVLQEQARVATVETGTVAELVKKYRQQLGLPAEVVVFVDGVKLSSCDTIPSDAHRIELIKPAGTKGADIPFAQSDAVKIVIAREDTAELVVRHPIQEGKISLSLENMLPEMGMEILSRGRNYLTIGYFETEVKVTRSNLRPIATMVRRLQGGFSENSELTLNTVIAGESESPLRIELNGETFTGCRELVAGETLVIVLPGEASQEDFEAWAADQRQNADGAVISAHIDRDDAIEKRMAKLMAMNWAELRIAAAKLDVKAAGAGRTADAVRADILLKEFPEVDEAKVYNAYLAEFAPELLDAPVVETED